MKFLLIGRMPIAEGNRLMKTGKLTGLVQSILAEIKPEAVYFGLKDGQRAMYMVVDLAESSQIPSVAEPLFLSFGGDLEWIPVMTPADLAKAGPSIEAAVKKYGG